MRIFGIAALFVSVGLGVGFASRSQQYEFLLEAKVDADWTWTGGEYLDVGGPRGEIVEMLKAGDKVRYVLVQHLTFDMECEIYQITRGKQFSQYSYGVAAFYGTLGGIAAAPLIAWLVAFIVVQASKRPKPAP